MAGFDQACRIRDSSIANAIDLVCRRRSAPIATSGATGLGMAHVIVLQDALQRRMGARPLPRVSGSNAALPIGANEIDRAILLLDAAARRAQLLTTQGNVACGADVLAAEVETIVQLLGIARSLTARLG